MAKVKKKDNIQCREGGQDMATSISALRRINPCSLNKTVPALSPSGKKQVTSQGD